ncbi:group III truncated hemoglobin [Poriferisphaera sp. WC338]|uniref:group III truncated hemoglobin n=1 Tax=Poriferisphaera sp. WC338 TaxID=3425129 RepID=UPI003D816D85
MSEQEKSLPSGLPIEDESGSVSLPLSERVGGARETVGVTEAGIRRLVYTFYDRIQNHETLGPIFNEQITDWEPHLKKMCDFWSSAILRTGRYAGRPLPVHRRLPDLSANLYRDWLGLFYQTTGEIFEPSDARLFNEMAMRMAMNMTHALGLGELHISDIQEGI